MTSQFFVDLDMPGRVEVAHYLLSKGANVQARDANEVSGPLLALCSLPFSDPTS